MDKSIGNVIFIPQVSCGGFENEEFDVKYINFGQVLRKLCVFEVRVLNLKDSRKSVKCDFISKVYNS